MFLSVKNTGKISQAQIEIKGITVIAGVNNTGKSTIGKVLFCLFNSFYNIDQQIERERTNSISRILEFDYRVNLDIISILDDFAEYVIRRKDIYINNKDQLSNDLRDLPTQTDKNIGQYLNSDLLLNAVEKIIRILNVSDDEIFVTVFKKRLQSEFNMQINSIYHPDLCSEIYLKIKDKEVNVVIDGNESIRITNSFGLNTEVIYMDDPLALDDLRYNLSTGNHREHLREKLTARNEASLVKSAINQILTDKKLGIIFKKLNNVCGGEMVKRPNSSLVLDYREGNSEIALDIKNVSTGIKTFAILKTLLQNGSLEENGIIVLDEPEIHLHPEWQLVFAELIVLLQKEFNMHILLNTHSPYFLDAIDVFSHKYGISDKCRYYLAEAVEKTAVITDVSHNIEKIYDKLSRPLQILENERYKDD